MEKRVEAIRALMHDVDAVVVSSASNRFYLSGFKSSAGTVFITKSRAFFVTDGRYFEAASKAVRHMDVVRGGQSVLRDIAELCKAQQVSKLGFEDLETTVAVFNLYRDEMPEIELLPLGNRLLQLRACKDANEVELIRRAQTITDQAFLEVLNYIKAGRTEKECAKFLEDAMSRFGADAIAFPIIAVGGKNASLPHGKPSEYALKEFDFLTMDFGAVYQGYVSDMTRTVAIGGTTEEMAIVYSTVLSAQEAALAYAKPGVQCRDVDKVARDLIAERGYGDCFVHSLGHSIGIDVHEKPGFSPLYDDLLQPGMCLTVEPGVYLPEKFGVRIEDDIVITEDGNQNLTTGPKALLVL